MTIGVGGKLTKLTKDAAILIVQEEAQRHTLDASLGARKSCNCGAWTGGNGSLAGYRNHVVTAILDALRREG